MVRNGDLVGVWPVLGLGHLENFRARAENRKTQIPGARVPKRKKKLPRYPRWLSATFLHFTFWPTGPPRGGKSRNIGFLGHFGLGRPLAQTKKTQTASLRPKREKQIPFRSVLIPSLVRVTQLGRWYPQSDVGPNCVGWGRNLSVGDRFCRLGSQPEKKSPTCKKLKS